MAYNTYVRNSAHRRARARVPGIKVLLYVLRIPPLITLDTYITSRSAEGQYSLRRYVSKTSRAIAIARLKPSITRIVPCLASAPYPLNRDRPLNYFFGVKRSQHIVSSTYRVAHLAIAISS